MGGLRRITHWEGPMATTKKCEKGKDPKSCSAEQIRKCHGTTKHACAKK
jgi:hypothetical protein